MIKHIVFFGIMMVAGYLYLTERTITHGPGEVAPDAPTQRHAFGERHFEHQGYRIEPLARFNSEVRLLSKEWYYNGQLAEISPVDFMVGWGPMSDERVLNEVLIKQNDRYFSWQLTHYPIPLNKMVRHSANIHLVPASEEVKAKLREVLKGHVVKLKGLLVEISDGNGWSAESSLTRKDYGEDASEILWLEELKISE